MSLFDEAVDRDTPFVDRTPFSYEYIPDEIVHRNEEIKALRQELEPLLNQSTSHEYRELDTVVFLVGEYGTGKTISAKHVLQDLDSTAEEAGIPLHVHEVGTMNDMDSYYDVLRYLVNKLRVERIQSGDLDPDDVEKSEFAPGTMESTLRTAFRDELAAREGPVLMLVDDIDELSSEHRNQFLEHFVRPKGAESSLSLVATSAEEQLSSTFSDRINSAINLEEIRFEPYEAEELQDLLDQHAEEAFVSGFLTDEARTLCATKSVKWAGGDARDALKLLERAAKLAEREEADSLTASHIERTS